MNVKRMIATGAALMVGAYAAHAMTIRELHALEKSDKRHGPEYVQYYLIGAMEGVVAANAQALRAGSRPLLCINGRRLEPRIARSLFDTELKRNAALYEADMPVELVMLNALATSYAC